MNQRCDELAESASTADDEPSNANDALLNVRADVFWFYFSCNYYFHVLMLEFFKNLVHYSQNQ